MGTYTPTEWIDDSSPFVRASNLNKLENALANTLQKDETASFTPIGSYNPATKKYVDDLVALITGGAGTATWGAILGTITDQADLASKIITDSGSNANGEYVKYGDGTLVCSYVGAGNYYGATVTNIGGIYRTNTATWTFPTGFISTPSISGSGVYRFGLLSDWIGIYQPSTIDVGSYAMCVSSKLSDEVAYPMLMAIGRWK